MNASASPDPPRASLTGTTPPAWIRIHALVSSPAALWVAAGWGLAEAALFFIVPDVWLGFVSLYAPRRMVVTLLATVAGALVGATLLFLATPVLGPSLGRLLTDLPGSGRRTWASSASSSWRMAGRRSSAGPCRACP